MNCDGQPFIQYRMQKLSLVRLASYVAIVAIAILLRHQIGVIPLHLLSEDEQETLRTEPERRKADHIVVSSVGFKDTKLSGSEVFTIAQRKLREEGKSVDGYLPPRVELRVVDGHLRWVLHYIAMMGPFQFEIRIDDSTGIASYEDTTAPM